MHVTEKRLYTIDLHKQQGRYPVYKAREPLFPWVQKIADVVQRCFSYLKLLWDKVNCKKIPPPPPPLVLIDESFKMSKVATDEDPKTVFYRDFNEFLDQFQDEVPNLKEESLYKVCLNLNAIKHCKPGFNGSRELVKELIPIFKESLNEEAVEEKKEPLPDPDPGLMITKTDLLEKNDNYKRYQHLVRWAIRNDKDLASEKIIEWQKIVYTIEDEEEKKRFLSTIAFRYVELGKFDEALMLVEFMNETRVERLAYRAIDADRIDIAEKTLEVLKKLIEKIVERGVFTLNRNLDWMARHYAIKGDFENALKTFRRIFPRKNSQLGISEIARQMTKRNLNIFDFLTDDEKIKFKSQAKLYTHLAKLEMVHEEILKCGLSDDFVKDLGKKIINHLQDDRLIQKFRAVFAHWNETDFELKMEINKFILIDLLDSILDKNKKLLNDLIGDGIDSFDCLLSPIAEHVEKYIKENSEESFVNQFYERYLEFVALNGPIEALPSILPMMKKIEDKAVLLDIFVKTHENFDSVVK